MKRKTLVGTLLGIAGLAFVLRALPLLRQGGAVGLGGFDDGVYFSAAGLFVDGLAPYRDFVFLHPPGVILALSPIALTGEHVVGYADAFAAARWLVCLVGAANTLLVGVATFRWRGPIAAIVAAGLYAVFPPAVRAEGSILLEPFVNLAALGAALAWLGRGSLGKIDRRVVVAGVLLGVAASFKVYGGLLLLAALVAVPLRGALRDRVLLVLSAAMGFLVIVVPFALRGGVGEFLKQVLGAQLGRPPAHGQLGDIESAFDRGLHMLYYAPAWPERFPGWIGALLISFGSVVALWAWRTGGRHGRFWSAAWVSTVTLLLLAPSYYDQYPVVLAPATSVLAGAAAQSLLRVRFALVRTGVMAAAIGIPLLISGWFLNQTRGREPIPDFGSVLRKAVPRRACLYTDPPVLAIAADRLPDSPGGANPLIDPFGEMFYLAYERGGKYRSLADAFKAEVSQQRMQQVLGDCAFVALYQRQTNPVRWSRETRAQFRADFELVAAPRGILATLWRQRRAG